ncbi:MAG: hypothetical protein COW85_06130 [Ignavibacteria bacterium CG22_combo_CG10-13_8_21_14_all_37_15]|nr:hypothetical protein [Ignavibacteria bacterium]PIP77993.1 MAG: hypothetical protein COW85_06130 [Ignavibacteria bacterium CG22_combo_CG10-13_8_21_14_all_37_15]PIS45100.1 MAG: hypothetical protein COT22_07085 [Ignavibacteria bacterium CG08_land_8_20_14_0_20_37_9]PIX94724.1 MAG: hypothetical protein COZ25_04070 [Ignavibacteria bacterium CG_4_10_14_3_um_filter_37_18]PJC57895.1 MAG: hypothetical protein CO025_11060 [Ignavibacteria bacterium CG_4_9_14_0_2_um_filter_37_13]
MAEKDILKYSYTFKLKSGLEKTFVVSVDKSSLSIIYKNNGSFPEWTKLQNFKCSHCELDPKIHEYCPLAINLVDIIQTFQEYNSFDEAEITVETENRNYSKTTSIQSGVSSMLGIRMVTSGCPVMGKLKPLIPTHLPFASLEETEMRVLSSYLLAQYVKWKRGGEADWEMTNLINIYEDIRILNHNVSKKIADLEKKDVSINSLIVLNNFADYVTFTLDEKMLDDFETQFKEFM